MNMPYFVSCLIKFICTLSTLLLTFYRSLLNIFHEFKFETVGGNTKNVKTCFIVSGTFRRSPLLAEWRGPKVKDQFYCPL